MNKLFKKPSAIALFAVLLTAVGIWVIKTSSKNIQPESLTAVGFKVAEETSATQQLDISGFVRGEKRAEVSPMASGKIIRIFKHEGDSVRKGEVLAAIDASQSVAQVAAANASVEALRKTLDDNKDYYDQTVDQAKEAGADSESVQTAKRARDLQIQAAKDQLIAAEGALEVAKSAQGNFTLTAPFAGTISTVYSREGGFANFSMPLFSLSTQNSLEIETYVSATQARLVTLGLIANFKLADGETVNATVTNVAPGSDSNNFKTLVRFHLNDEAGLLRLGDFLEGKLAIPTEKSSIYLPKKAIVNRGGALMVFILDDNNTVHQSLVKTGNEKYESIEITEGISTGQKIIVEGQQYLNNRSTVKPYESR